MAASLRVQDAPDLRSRADGVKSVRGLLWRGLGAPAVEHDLLGAFLGARGWTPEAIHVDLDDMLFVASCQPGFSVAANLIADAIEADAGVFVFGDYDVDGITSTAIWRTVCAAYRVRAESKIPSRSEGYGFSAAAAGMPRALRCRLLICVDSVPTASPRSTWPGGTASPRSSSTTTCRRPAEAARVSRVRTPSSTGISPTIR